MAARPQTRKGVRPQGEQPAKPAAMRRKRAEKKRPQRRTLGDLPLAVVGVGASAGGLDALEQFFRAVPKTTGIAFVAILHLDPTHESLLPEILARHTEIPVVVASDNLMVQRDHIYVIPPGTRLSIHDGALRTTPVPAGQGMRLPLDWFLGSLAEDCGERSVGVILSGTGSDGSIGLKTVNERGGLVIAQDPEEAAYDGMPRSAVATGAVDLVLPIAKIPESLQRYAAQMSLEAARRRSLPDAELAKPLADIVRLLGRKTSRDFAQYKDGTLLRRIRRRMAMHGVDSLESYVRLLRSDTGEVTLLAKDLLIHVTGFFRDPKAFQTLADRAIPELIRGNPNQPIRIWVPGCSTGEEAYSIAMLILDATARVKREAKLQIFATDIDDEAIAFARAGLYPESIQSEVPRALFERYFAKEGHGYRVASQVRETVLFSVHDLLSDAPFSRLDLISCRNVMIYLRSDAQERLLSIFHFALGEGGILFLGASETAERAVDMFEPVVAAQRIYRRTGGRPAREGKFAPGIIERSRMLWPRPAVPANETRIDLMQVGEHALLETYAPASALINRRNEGLHYYGAIDRYLRVPAGAANRDILSMAREGLAPKLRIAVHQAGQDRVRTVVTGATAKRNGQVGHVTIAVQPLQTDGQEFLLVSFIDEPEVPEEPQRPPTSPQEASRITELEEELATTRRELENTVRDLESANEELMTANEEAMSVNEEFQSTNEELETSKEELQSLNEELTAVNAQLQEAVEQQRGTSDDLQNILNSSDVATLFLDRDFNIRFFTPSAKSLFGVIPSDIGRPLADLARRFSGVDVLADVRAVLASLTPAHREIRTETGEWYACRILPYRTRDDRIEGVVITFAEITETKTVQGEIQAARAYAESIVDTVTQPLIVLDAEMRVISASRSFYRTFNAKPADTVGRHVGETAARHLDIPKLRTFIQEIHDGKAASESCEIEVDQPLLGRRALIVTAREFTDHGAGLRRVLIAIDDVTKFRDTERSLQAAKELAEQANLAKSRFLATASHDLRQPLQSLRMLRGVLARKVTDQEALAIVARFGESLDALSGMFDALLDINRLEAGVVHPAVVAFPIGGLLARLEEEFAMHAKAVELGWRMMPSSAVVRSDPLLIERILRNLIANALNYTEKGRVLVGCRRRGRNLRIEVWDTGVGIPEGELQLIFQEFRQRGAPPPNRGRGIGLGLAIVQRLAELLGHRVEVRSRVGKGSMFAIEVPLADDDAKQAPLGRKRANLTGPAVRGTILIVDDDTAVRETLAELIATDGHRTATAGSGAAALAQIDSEVVQPDLIITDYTLPGGMDGIAAIDALRDAMGRETPAIILTGDISGATLQRMQQKGLPYLIKPVHAEEILEVIGRLLPMQPAPAAAPAEPEGGGQGNGEADAPATVFVVDDDHAVRDSMRLLLETEGHSVQTFASAERFLAAYDPRRTGCIVLDDVLPGMDGFALMARLREWGSHLPVIMITGQGDVKMAVRAMQTGATTFLEKPTDDAELVASVSRAMRQEQDREARLGEHKAVAERLGLLTHRQREILDLLIAGLSSKEMAEKLGISQRTVETHRAAIMDTMQAKSVADLVRSVVSASDPPRARDT